jgi:hypothetical protein
VLHAVSVPPTFTLALAPLAAVLGAVLAVVDAGFRFRRPGAGSAIAILELVLGLLLFVAGFRPVHQFVSTTIPVLYLAVPLEVVLIVLLLLRSSRKGGLVWLTVAAVLVNGLTAVLAVTRLG